MPSERRPAVPLIPVSVRITTEKPNAGWWYWTFTFEEERYGDRSIEPWVETGKNRRSWQCLMACSEVWDPVPKIHRFVSWLANADDGCNAMEIDEEGPSFFIQTWSLGEKLVQVRMKREYSDTWNFQYDLVIDRNNLVSQLHDALISFGKHGGWGLDWLLQEADDEDFPESGITIDETTIPTGRIT